MCGIGGILRRDGRPIDERWLDFIDQRIIYRGPDGHGRFHDRVETEDNGRKRIVEVAFVHRRLAVIDPADGRQPMVSECGRHDGEGLVAVVFNGCIYNHRDLRTELEGRGHTFVTDHSDTEVLIHGYREWGQDLEGHLEGMYAFAIWDRTNASLMLVRDRFGEKPLYVRALTDNGDDAICFCSDAFALAQPTGLSFESSRVGANLQSPAAQEHDVSQDGGIYSPPSLPSHHPTALTRWTSTYLQTGYNWRGRTVYDGYVGGDSPITSGVRNRDPGLAEQLPSLIAPFQSPQGRIIGLTELEELVDRAVQMRLESDVPLGCFLSGGIDSSLIAALARRHRPDLQTYCLRMPVREYDESEPAEQVADYLGTRHTTLDVDPDPATDLVFLIQTLGQPFGDSSILPTYWVCRAAREHVTVMLSGDGGDELFVGYERYLAARHLKRWRTILALLPANRLLRHHPKSKWHKLGRLVMMAREYPQLGVLAMESIFPLSLIEELLEHPIHSPPSQMARVDAAAALRQVDLRNYLPDDLLCKSDTASMAVDVEVRCPFLDRAVAGAAISMSLDRLLPGGQRKGLLKRLAARHLPEETLHRPKMGFAIPIDEWFRSDFGGLRTMLLDYVAADRPFGPIELDRTTIDRMLDEHLERRHHHGHRLFALLSLAIWARHVHEGIDART